MFRKRLASFLSALILSVSSLFALAPVLVHAAVATCTWTGTGGNNSFSTPGNWSGCDHGSGAEAPTSGDSLVFPESATNKGPVNDLSSATFATISFTGSAGVGFALSGTSFTLTGGINDTSTGPSNSFSMDITLSGASQTFAKTDATRSLFMGSGNVVKTLSMGTTNLTLSGNVSLYANISGSGTITKTGSGEAKLAVANTFTGAVAVNSGRLVLGDKDSLGTAAGATTVADGAQLAFDFNLKNPAVETYTVTEPLTLGGDGDGSNLSDYALGVVGCFEDDCFSTSNVTFSGPITLTAATKFAADAKITLTGALSGNFGMSMAGGFRGKIVVNGSPNTTQTANGTELTAAEETDTYSDDQSSQDISVGYKQTAVVTGKRGSAFIEYGGTLKGTGTLTGETDIEDGAHLAPGMSPGCLSTGDLFFSTGANYDVELGGTTECTEYDQTKVTGDVDLSDATLNISFYNGFKPTKDQVYKIIDNDGADAVSGTFLNLAEGATFTANGYVFKVSYVGGSGNDVTVTVLSVPTTPNTGFKLLLNHPLQSFLATSLLSGLMIVLAKRYQKATVRIRK